MNPFLSKSNIFLCVVIFTLILKLTVKREENLMMKENKGKEVKEMEADSFSIYVENNPENKRIENFLSVDINKISNHDAKLTVFQLLAFPLQNICR